MRVPGLLDFCPIDLWPAPSQRLIALDHAHLVELEQGAPHRSARLGTAVAPQRRLEYLAGRAGAAALLQAHGAATIEVTSGPDRAPRWPQGFTGSISHSPELAWVAVRPLGTCASIGLDTESILDDESASWVARHCLRAGELETCGADRSRSLLTMYTLLFSAKEAFFKCVYPRVRCHFNYADVEVASVAGSELHVRIVDSPGEGLLAGFTLTGRFRVALGHVFTGFQLPATSLEPSI